MGPPKIPGLPDSVQLAPSLIENAAKKSNKKKKKSSSNHNSQYQNNSQSLAVKNQIESEIDTHESIDANDSANQVEPAKKLRNLRKKLRDIETLVRDHHIMFSRILNFLFVIKKLEIKPCGQGSRIRDVEAFWYKAEIRIIYFVPLCLIVWFTLTLDF